MSRTMTAALAALLLCPAPALAQAYPAKTVRIIVPFAAGGVLDGLMRPVSQQLSEQVLPAEGKSRFLANVPTFVDEGYDFRPSSWFGLFVQSQTPRPIVNRIHADMRKILMNPPFQEKVLLPQFYEPVGNTPEEFTAFLAGSAREPRSWSGSPA